MIFRCMNTFFILQFYVTKCNVANKKSANQLEKVLPVVLGHESEEGKEGPAEGVKARVAIVGVPACLQACESIRTLSIQKKKSSLIPDL